MGFSIAENDRTDKARLISCRMAHGSQAVRQAGRQVADSQAVQAGRAGRADSQWQTARQY